MKCSQQANLGMNIVWGWGTGEIGVTANSVSFWGDKNVLKSIVVTLVI